MKNLTSQHGHLHIGLLVVAVITMVGMTGFSVYNNQSNASAGTPNSKYDSPECLALDDLPDAQFDAMTDAQIDAICGPEPADDPVLNNDPCLSEASEALSDEEYNKLCGTKGGPEEPLGATVDEGTDGGSAPELGEGIDADGQSSGGKTSGSKLSGKISLASKQACITSASQFPLAQIQSYGNARIKARKSALTITTKKVNNNQFDAVVAKNLKARAKAANARVKAAAKKSNKSGSQAGKVTVKIPKSHIKLIKKDIKTYNKKLNTAKSKLKASTTPSQAADVMCSAIFDTRIYSYLVPKIQAQEKIDGLAAQTAAYDINHQASSYVRKLQGKTATSSRSASPASIKSRVNALQKNLDSITINSVSGNNKGVFKSKLAPEYNSIKALIKNGER